MFNVSNYLRRWDPCSLCEWKQEYDYDTWYIYVIMRGDGCKVVCNHSSIRNEMQGQVRAIMSRFQTYKVPLFVRKVNATIELS